MCVGGRRANDALVQQGCFSNVNDQQGKNQIPEFQCCVNDDCLFWAGRGRKEGWGETGAQHPPTVQHPARAGFQLGLTPLWLPQWRARLWKQSRTEQANTTLEQGVFGTTRRRFICPVTGHYGWALEHGFNQVAWSLDSTLGLVSFFFFFWGEGAGLGLLGVFLFSGCIVINSQNGCNGSSPEPGEGWLAAVRASGTAQPGSPRW